MAWLSVIVAPGVGAVRKVLAQLNGEQAVTVPT